MLKYISRVNIKEVVTWLESNLKDGKIYKLSVEDANSRSLQMNDRFNGWLTYLWQWLNDNMELDHVIDRDIELKRRVLLRACSIPDDSLLEGMKPWPYKIVKTRIYNDDRIVEILEPSMRTSNKTNGQLMTACWAIELVAKTLGCELPEKEMG